MTKATTLARAMLVPAGVVLVSPACSSSEVANAGPGDSASDSSTSPGSDGSSPPSEGGWDSGVTHLPGPDGGDAPTPSEGDAAAGSGGSGGDVEAPPLDGGATPFACNLVIGNTTTQQWFDGGFLTYPGIDPTRWEMYFVGHHYIDAWASPTDTAWTTPLDNGHACTTDSTTPDRVIFIATKAPPYPDESFYQTNLTSIVGIIQSKYKPKRIELMTLIRAPNNVPCSGTAATSEQIIPPAEDQGISATQAAFPGLVFAVPPLYVPTCSDFNPGAPQYTTAGAADVAEVYGAYYAMNP
jgi:hypothetical protein